MNNQILNISQVKKMYENTGVEFLSLGDASIKQVEETQIDTRKAMAYERLVKIQAFMKSNREPVTIKSLAKEFGISSTTAVKDINELLEASLIRLVSSKTRYKKYIYAKLN